MKTEMMLGIFGGDPGDTHTHELLVEVRDGKIYAEHPIYGDFSARCKITGEVDVKGWGELVNGPAYRVDYGTCDVALIPKREWERVLAGDKERRPL